MTATATSEVVPRKDQREKIRNKFQHFFLLVEHFLGGASGKESACHAGDARDLGLIPGSERSPGKPRITCICSPQTPLPSRPPHNTEQFPVLYSRSLLVIHFKYSSVYMSVPSSLTIPSLRFFPSGNRKFIL